MLKWDRRSTQCTKRKKSTKTKTKKHTRKAGDENDEEEKERDEEEEESVTRPKTYLGPNGHDYSQLEDPGGDNNSKFDEVEIHALLAERLQAKFTRDFRKADNIQMELIEGGVFVHDERKEWRADGVPYESFTGVDYNFSIPTQNWYKTPNRAKKNKC